MALITTKLMPLFLGIRVCFPFNNFPFFFILHLLNPACMSNLKYIHYRARMNNLVSDLERINSIVNVLTKYCTDNAIFIYTLDTYVISADTTSL